MIPKVSFVIPTYQSAAWTPHAIESAQKQDYANIEIIVVDDASTDTTRQVVEFMAGNDSRIKYIRLPKNMGRSEARNTGNKEATGDIIMVLDADDISHPDRAKLTVQKLKNADFVHGYANVIDVIGNVLGQSQSEVFNKERALKDKLNYMVHSTCAYTKDIATSFKYKSGEPSRLGLDDWQFQLEVGLSGARMEFIPSIIGDYRELETGVSKKRDPAQVEAYKTAFIEGLRVVA